MSDSLMIASDENAKQNPNLELSHKVFLLETILKRDEDAANLKEKILEEVIADSMASFYCELCEKFAWHADEETLNKMIAANTASMVEFERKIIDAAENAGDTEVNSQVGIIAVSSKSPSELFFLIES